LGLDNREVSEVGKSVAHKILEKHLVKGTLEPGKEVAVKIDQTLTQDATGTMAYLQFEAMDIPKVKTELSVSYVDHNTLQSGFENADDHRFLESVAAKHGIYFSRPGNGICHQVHLERFGVPGKTLLGSDSHTPTGGGIGMIAIGAGGLDVAAAMAGYPFHVPAPKVVLVKLTGRLPDWVAAKDVILELLRRLSVKGGVGKIMEYGGPGVETLTVPERATITNMGAELGATTSVFPSDAVTREFLKAQGRESDWSEIKADPDAQYDEVVELDLSTLEPMVAQPHSPDNVVKVSEIEGKPVQQVALGSCTNSSLKDLLTAAAVLDGKTIPAGMSLVVSPGSKQVFEMIARSGDLAKIVAAGARVLESACGPCIGMGQSPPSGSTTLRTFNRNFLGRSGTKDADVYLVSVETALAAALSGKVTDPRKLGKAPKIALPAQFLVNDNMIIKPPDDGSKVEVLRGPNIKPLPKAEPLPDRIEGKVLLKVEDNITTDHIMPAGAKILPLRSNIPAICEYVFEVVDPSFCSRAKQEGGGFIVGGENYGQGSSREHAALAPMYLGVKWVLAKSFARIHKANLVNFGIIPVTFADAADYGRIDSGDSVRVEGVRDSIEKGEMLTLINETKGIELKAQYDLSDRQRQTLLDGGLLNHVKKAVSGR
jgi:aconitate hydratase